VSALIVVSGAERLAETAADRMTALASEAIAERGRFVLALSGGSTPRPVYRLLAQGGRSLAIDWPRVELFWGDERCVPPDHPNSNYRMARRALLDGVGIPASNVHRIRGELPPQEAAAAYRSELKAVLGQTGRFDLILLGLGSDGHTASLFPGTRAVEEQQQNVVAAYVEKLATWRITLTLPVINKARHVLFLVRGDGKAEALARVQGGEQLPAGLVQPGEGTLTWIVDRDAAVALPTPGIAG
jgi:6-phosphogluconolactonase